ncbi:germinal-center associated nuclear protein [Anoplophora glabripennis]|nr:germinal-center associated nuclear protein [Anoplophora glabripennis]
MDSPEAQTSNEYYKIICRNYPSEFILDKNLAKEYFRQFGKLKRLTFKPKLRICTVEYANRDSYLNALNNAGEYKGTIFKVSSEKSPESKKRKMKNPEPIWVDDDEVGAELAAMGGFAPKGYTFPDVTSTEILSEVSRVEKVPKLKRSWATDMQRLKKKPKIKEKTSQKAHTEEMSKYVELISIIKSQAVTVEEKFKVLDARDKLIRIKSKQKIKLKSSPTIGTCPDMCPEKERLMRETKHQVALYEQEDNGRSMNQSKAIKQYSRSSADQESPLPHELRPVSVLQMTMSYLMHNIIDMCETNDVNLAEWYHFMWDRTRGIRKDITQQELCSQGAVELIEQCARFHIHCSARLVAEDPSVFDQKINTENLTKCLQSLKYMYHDLQLKGEKCPNEAEFRAYIILLNLNDGNFMWEVQELRHEIQKSKEMKFALDVYSAIDKNNYVKFFKLVYSTTYLNACILMRYFVQVRITAIKTLLKCYTSRAFRSTYPLGELKHLLAFDDIESTTDFMQAYGLFINDDRTHIVLEKNTFALPEIPYVLDRSLNVIESKRVCSVGKIVCGKELPPKTFEQHMPQNSFDTRGHLMYEDLLEESDLDQTEMQFEEIAQVPISTDNLSVTKVDSGSIPDVFQQPTKENVLGSIFAPAKPEVVPIVPKQPPLGLFSKPVESQKSVFAKDAPSIFGGTTVTKPVQTDSGLKDETDSNQWSSSSSNIFALHRDDAVLAKPYPIFGGAAVIKPLENIPTAAPKKGGFHFDLPVTTLQQIKPNVLSAPIQTPQPFRQKIDVPPPPVTSVAENLKELEKKKEEEERERVRREKEQLRKQEAEKKRLAKKKKEEEKLRMIKKQKQEEELRRRMEQLRKEEEYRKNKEIHDTVGSILRNIVKEVDDKICLERLRDIKQKMRDRTLLRIVHKWQQIVLKNKRKRKAMDCSPVWVNTKTLEQCAEELYTTSQELTLKLRKRYKYGKALDIEPIEEDKISKINLFQLTYSSLNQRFFDFKGTLQKNIFWKVEISLPDHYELRNGLIRIEDTLKDAFKWEDRNGTIMLVEQTKPNPMQSITYCIERQRGLYVRYGDAHGIIFIAKDFNALLQRRILENLKDLGVFTKVPIVVILQEYREGECKLQSLIEQNIVSDYIILIQNITPRSLVRLIEESLLFLASKAEKPPPLELDTMSAFLRKYLCTEIWKRANSFAKWNTYYKSSLRDPNIVICLYNEAVEKLTKIVLNKSCFEYPSFPEVFKDYLQSEIPDYLPCNYYYFPKFWKSEMYVSKLEKILKGFALPKWSDKWPPSNELELEVNVSKYCTKVFTEPEKPFYKIMSVMLRDLDPNVNFEDMKKVLWTDVIEVLALEKLKETNLGLSGTSFETKSIFNQFVVVYDVNTLENYNKSDWFYVGNPMIKKYVEQKMKHEKMEDKRDSETKLELDLSIDLDKTISEVTNQLTNKQNNLQLKKELAEFNEMINDLETSIKIHKKISSMIGDNLRKAIAEN